ncbi:uncharacterized protein LOC112516181 [Cynara cardunculus var. scolymus]|uniref:uncharacterized protein LOC112516181 n=1 Tax=Cynara cardunculus var. scolymus TaxID=59895 RepID=UPI000D62ACE8|nr:uncharacterized protein LOC112516181 [Cynara cardunculus var. scolymus]
MGVNDDHDEQELEALDTLSLADFPLTDDGDSGFQNHLPPNTPSEDFFEFFNGGLGHYSEEHRMSHAEDIIFAGKLIPINDQPPPPPPPRMQNQTRKQKQIHRRRSESMRELKSTTNNPTATRLVRNSHSLDYKKLNRNSRYNYCEPTAEIHRNSLGNKFSSSSSRWSDLMFGPVKVPTEMDLRDIRNRQIIQNTTKSLFPIVEGGDGFAVSRIGDHRKTSWGVLGILSCKSSGSVAVTMP